MNYPNPTMRYLGRNQTVIDGVNVYDRFTEILKESLNAECPMQFIWQEGPSPNTGGHCLMLYYFDRKVNDLYNAAWDRVIDEFTPTTSVEIA